MTSPFFSGRKVVAAEELTGPRVYSTDLLPSLYDLKKLDEGAAIAARALKIKIITKGLVTLNCAHLVSPVAVRLLEIHPDLMEGAAILPAFRTDKADLSSLIASTGDHAAAGIDEARLDAHIKQLEGKLKQVLPWDLSGVSDSYRSAVIGGLQNPQSIIANELKATYELEPNELEAIAQGIESVDFRESVNLRNHIATLSPNIREPLLRFASACYHRVGTGVVRCETGMDLGPLSDFKAADLVLAGRVEGTLSDEAVFLELFLGFALDTIQARALPSQIIDALRFDAAHQLGSALRDQGFQARYDGIIAEYAAAKSIGNPHEALESLDEEKIAAVAGELAGSFNKAVLDELPGYNTRIQSEAKDKVYGTFGDIFKEGLGQVPVVSNIVAACTMMGHVIDAVGNTTKLIATRDQKAAFDSAQERKAKDIKGAISGLKTTDKKKKKLLNAVALLSDVHGINIGRA